MLEMLVCAYHIELGHNEINQGMTKEIIEIYVEMFSPPQGRGEFDFIEQARIVCDSMNSLWLENLKPAETNTWGDQVRPSDKSLSHDSSSLVQILEDDTHDDYRSLVQFIEDDKPDNHADLSQITGESTTFSRHDQLVNIVGGAYNRKDQAIQSVVSGISTSESAVPITLTHDREKMIAHLVPLLEELEAHPLIELAKPDAKAQIFKTLSMAAGTISNGTPIGGIGPKNPEYLEKVIIDAFSRVQNLRGR